MTFAVRVALTLVGLGWLAGGLAFMFAPGDICPQFHIVPEGVEGMATIRGDLGGLFLAGAVLTFLGLFRRNASFLYAAGILSTCVAGNRGLSALIDGMAENTVQNLAIEAVSIAILFYSARYMAGLSAAEEGGRG